MRKWSIYSLRDPSIDDKKIAIRYIGVVRDRRRETGDKAIRERLKEHIYDARQKKNRPVCKWVGTLLERGLLPVLDVLSSGEGDSWEEAEIAAIAQYQAEGYRLLNLKPGGGKREYGEATGHTRLKLSQAARGRRADQAEREMRRHATAAFKSRSLLNAKEIQPRAAISRILARAARMIHAGARFEKFEHFARFSRALGGGHIQDLSRYFDTIENFNIAIKAFFWDECEPFDTFQIPTYVRNAPIRGTPFQRTIIEEYNKGKTLDEIAKALNAQGFRTLQRTPWTMYALLKHTQRLGLDTSFRTQLNAEDVARFKASYAAVANLPRSPFKVGLDRVLKTASPIAAEIITRAVERKVREVQEKSALAVTLSHADANHASQSSDDPD